MTVKKTWSEVDFDEMGWHDSYIHAISFPNEHLEFVLDIDYLFERSLDYVSNKYTFWVSPCLLSFHSVLNLKMCLDFRDAIGLEILDLHRSNSRLSPNGKTTVWDFEIVTSRGNIKFESSGFTQLVKEQPVFSHSQVLKRS